MWPGNEAGKYSLGETLTLHSPIKLVISGAMWGGQAGFCAGSYTAAKSLRHSLFPITQSSAISPFDCFTVSGILFHSNFAWSLQGEGKHKVKQLPFSGMDSCEWAIPMALFSRQSLVQGYITASKKK